MLEEGEPLEDCHFLFKLCSSLDNPSRYTHPYGKTYSEMEFFIVQTLSAFSLSTHKNNLVGKPSIQI